MNKYLTLSFLLLTALGIQAEQVDSAKMIPTRVVKLYSQAPAESNGYTDQDEWVKDGHKIYQIATPRLELYYPADTRKPMPVLLTIPGGGYLYVSSGNEGEDVAKYLCQRGIVIAVLKYRLPNGHENIPLSDACRAMELLRDSAAAWKLIPDKIGVMGFSAGGHLAGSLVTKYTSEKARPDYGILIYPVISTDSTLWHRGSVHQLLGDNPTAEQYAAWSLDKQVHAAMPPCLMAACTDDKTVPVDNTLLMYQAMRAQHVPTQLLILPTGGHGWGFRRDFERRDLVDNAIVQYIWSNVGDKKKEQLYRIVEKEVRANDGKKDWPKYERYQAQNDSIIHNHIPVKAVFMGNSITDHWGRWRPEFFAKYHCAARGISAQTTYEMLARMQADVVDLHPEMVFILAGANDLACNRGVISEEHILGNIRSMCDIAVAHGIRPMICSLLPHRAFLWNRAVGNPVARIDRINAQLKAYAQANGFGWIDYNSAMRAEDGGMREGLSPDEVHPYKEAYQIMEDIVTPYIATLDEPTQAASDLVRRVLPEHYRCFEVEIAPKETTNDWFELEQKGNKIVLRGTNGISVASALNYYLEHYTHSRIQWNSVNLHLGDSLPVVREKVHRETPYKYRYYFNYCTFNYSMSWWDWDRWQREIDFMAMHGINLPLALTGQNSIWQRVYRAMGFSDEELQSFFPGPAYFNWFWMGNLDGWGGPLPQSFMDGQEQLQKQILQRERELGMTPILPAFTGHVPPAFKDKFPNAKLKKTHWLDIAETYILDPTDPLFAQIGTAFLKESIRTFGTNHFYSSDTFNENEPPQNDSTYLSGISQQVYNAMLQADSAAVWVMQGWLFTQSREFWGEPQTLALLNAVPDNHIIILDLWTEAHPVWQRKQAFYGKPWIWCMLNNFGGNNLMYGRMDEVAKKPYRTFCDSASRNMCGIGLTPEAIETNPVIFEMMLDNIWRADSIAVLPWLHEYALSRYGMTNDTIDAAWQILYRTVYSGGRGHGGPSASIIAARPTLNKDGRWTETTKTYAPEDLLPAWSLLLSQSEALSNSDGYRYDLVDLTRQVLANYADSLQRQIAQAYEVGDLDMFEDKKEQFLQVILDMDTLLNTRPEWRLSTWVESARAWGITTAEKDLYERNAKNLITTWGSRDCSIYDYSWRLWSGMLRDYYYERWKQYFAYLEQCMTMHIDMEQKVFDEQIKDWEWQWVTSPSLPHSLNHSTTPSLLHSPSPSNEIQVCKHLFHLFCQRDGGLSR